MIKSLLCTVASVIALTGTPAVAADLGGNCCADLEERIAELEATTVRKGNRKVSVTVTGWVNEAIFTWDDSISRNVLRRYQLARAIALPLRRRRQAR